MPIFGTVDSHSIVENLLFLSLIFTFDCFSKSAIENYKSVEVQAVFMHTFHYLNWLGLFQNTWITKKEGAVCCKNNTKRLRECYFSKIPFFQQAAATAIRISLLSNVNVPRVQFTPNYGTLSQIVYIFRKKLWISKFWSGTTKISHRINQIKSSAQ